ncbi:MAG: helix-turn-helix domain-containing protein [Myxococcota bacterium]|nr:helix-turn-helix domain-containing protein [Myxococcota bacterium]
MLSTNSPPKKSYTTFQIAKIIGVSPPTIIKWANEGKIKVFRTPGGHRRISHAELMRFTSQFQYPISSSHAEQRKSTKPGILLLDSDSDYGQIFQEYFEESYDIKIVNDTFTLGLELGLIRPKILIWDCSDESFMNLLLLSKIRQHQAFSGLKIVALTSLYSQLRGPLAYNFDERVLKTESLVSLEEMFSSWL